MAPDERGPGPTGPPSPVGFSTTDPTGRTVWMDDATLQHAGEHEEFRQSPHWTTAAIEDPDEICRHTDYTDRRIYIGEARQPSDAAYAPIRRIVVVSESSTPSGKVITGYDHQSSRRPLTAGVVEWRRN